MISLENCILTIREFLALFESEPSVDDALDLERILDKLAVAQALVAAEFDSREWPNPPRLDYQKLREKVSQRFSTLGYYNIADRICGEPGQGKINVGDAIDDLADIFADLKEVLWRLENTSMNDAIWHFKLLYRTHWGRHLRSLQLFLYECVYHATGDAKWK